MASLRGQRLWKIPVNANGGVGQPASLFNGTYGRVRGVASAPDGTLWFSTSNRDGRGTNRPGDDRIVNRMAREGQGFIRKGDGPRPVIAHRLARHHRLLDVVCLTYHLIHVVSPCA